MRALIKTIRKRIEMIMRGEQKTRFYFLKFFLYLLSLVYGTGVKLRNSGYEKGVLSSKRLPCKVISVGNITLGGTGKTPLTLDLAKRLRRFGYRVVVISRGYKGGAERIGGIVSNGRQILMTPENAGDEPFMMARQLTPIQIPLIVGQNRFEAGMLAVTEFEPDVIILDDAFQHRKIERDIDLVLLDNRLPIGNKHLLPRGVLREPVFSLLRANAFVLTRSNSASHEVNAAAIAELQGKLQGRPVYRASHVSYLYKVITGDQTSTASCKSESLPHELKYIKGRKVFAFCGIARNDDFRCTVESFACDLRGFMGFPDHHWYSDDDFNAIFCSAEDTAADILLTTEKDYARLGHKIHCPVDLWVIGIQIFFGEDESAFDAFIKNRLEKPF